MVLICIENQGIVTQGRTIWRYSLFTNFVDCISENYTRNGRCLVFQSPKSNSKIKFLIENAIVTAFIQKFDYGITMIFKINGNTEIQNLIRPLYLF